MKKGLVLLGLLTLVLQSPAMAGERSQNIKAAVEKLSTCGNFIRFDEQNVYTGFGTYWTGNTQPRQPKPSVLKIMSIDQLTETQIQLQDSAVDLVRDGSSIYILTFAGIEEWDINHLQRIGIYRTNILAREYADEEHPRAFAKYGNKLVIAHGRLGISFLDLKTKKITRSFPVALSHKPLESVVNGIAVSGNRAYAVLDSYTLVGPREKPAFQGLIVIDLDKENPITELEGLDPGVDSIVADEKSAIVSYYGIPLVKYSVDSLARATKLPSALKRVWRFPLEGHPTGKASIDDRYYYTCFSKMPGEGQGSLFRSVPLAMDRLKLMLD